MVDEWLHHIVESDMAVHLPVFTSVIQKEEVILTYSDLDVGNMADRMWRCALCLLD